MTKAETKITTLIIIMTLMGLGMLFAVIPMDISAQENMTNNDKNMTNNDKNMTASNYGTISGAARGTS
ncbi:MAG: hypothetical protein ACPKQO_02820 [Nitrososphaeraceae archaeon]